MRSPQQIPTDMVAQYYEQRTSDGGLLISEATLISPMVSSSKNRIGDPEAGWFPNVPGIWTDEQVSAWKRVVHGVHTKDGVFFCQVFCKFLRNSELR